MGFIRAVIWYVTLAITLAFIKHKDKNHGK